MPASRLAWMATRGLGYDIGADEFRSSFRVYLPVVLRQFP